RAWHNSRLDRPGFRSRGRGQVHRRSRRPLNSVLPCFNKEMLRILLVEDNPADAHLLQTALQRTGVTVKTTLIGDGSLAMEYLNGTKDEHQFDVVLLDLSLPKLNGHEVLARIRDMEEYRGLPVIVLSRSSDPADVENCYRAGANSYICKPVHMEDIMKMA